MSEDDSYIVYLLCTGEAPYQTYVGMPNNKERRLKQHNGVLSGGARATAGRKGEWKRVLYVSGFPNKTTALQFEWAWKHFSKKQSGSALTRRIKSLFELFACEQPTSKATDFQSYVKDLQVVWEDDSIDPSLVIC